MSIKSIIDKEVPNGFVPSHLVYYLLTSLPGPNKTYLRQKKNMEGSESMKGRNGNNSSVIKNHESISIKINTGN